MEIRITPEAVEQAQNLVATLFGAGAQPRELSVPVAPEADAPTWGEVLTDAGIEMDGLTITQGGTRITADTPFSGGNAVVSRNVKNA